MSHATIVCYGTVPIGYWMTKEEGEVVQAAVVCGVSSLCFEQFWYCCKCVCVWGVGRLVFRLGVGGGMTAAFQRGDFEFEREELMV